MKILFVTYKSLGHGGAEVSTLNLAKELRLKGNEVIFAAAENYDGFKTFIFKEFKFPIFQIYNNYLKRFIVDIIKKENIDLIHVHHRMSTIAAIKAASKMKIPIVAHFRDYWFCCPRSSCLTPNYKRYDVCSYGIIFRYYPKKRLIWDLYKWFTIKQGWRTLNKADAKIAVSNVVKEKLKYCGINNNIYIVHNSRDLGEFLKVDKGDFKKNYNLKKIVVAFVGSFSYTKGAMNLLKISKKVLDKHKDVSFIFVGDGPLMNLMLDFKNLNKLDDVVFTGRLNNEKIPEVYANSDIVVFPNVWEEPFSGAIVEAMAAGKPIIASRLGGNKEIIVEGENGFLIDPDNLNEIENKLDMLINSETLRNKLGRFSKEHSKNFSNQVIAEKINKIYSALR